MNFKDTKLYKILSIPYPEYFIIPFRFLLGPVIQKINLKKPSEKAQTVILIFVCLISLGLVCLFEDIKNPIDLFIDIPLFSAQDIPKYLQTFYIAFLPLFSLIFTSVLKLFTDKDAPFFSVNGILFTLSASFIGILADSFVRNFVIERFSDYYTLYFDRTDLDSRRMFLMLLLIMVCAVYFSLDDFVNMSASILITPYLIIGLKYIYPEITLFKNSVLLYVVLTFILKLFLSLLEKAEIISLATGFIKKYCFTLLYQPVLYALLIIIPLLPVIWPLLLVVYRKWKKDKMMRETPENFYYQN